MQFTFPSLGYSDSIGYRFETEPLDGLRNTGQYIATQLRFFLTYGDGMCQHSHESLVQVDRWSDCLASLVDHLMIEDNGTDYTSKKDKLSYLSSYFTGQTAARAIEFALSVKWKEGSKRLYYSTHEEKISASESKRHDRRWNEVPDWADASAESAFRILSPEYYEGMLRRYRRYYDIRQFCLAKQLWGGKCETDFFEIPKKDTKLFSDSPHMTFEALLQLIEGNRASERAQWLTTRYKETISPEHLKKIEEAAAVALGA